MIGSDILYGKKRNLIINGYKGGNFMLDTIIKYLPVLGVSIIVNILLGLYHNIGMEGQTFDWKKLVQGATKAGVVAAAFVGLAYCFDATDTIIDLGVLELDPNLIMISAITIYMIKGVTTLANILGIKTNGKAEIVSNKKDTQEQGK